MAKPSSIERRVFRLVLMLNLLLLGSILGFAGWALEDLEQAMLDSDRDSEIQYFAENVDKHSVHRVVTAQMVSAYIPHGMDVAPILPLVFADLPVPYQGEVALLDKQYFVVTAHFPEGDYYLAKDLSLFEERETRLAIGLTILALVVVFVCYLLALIFSKRLSLPVRNLARSIASIKHADTRIVIPENHLDSELNAIARAMNALFVRLDEVLQRERTLLNMASHELRTPVSVVLGAARVIEARGHLQADDQKTLQRIIVAAEEMSANITALLALVRQQPQQLQKEPVDLTQLLTALCQDCVMANPAFADRIALNQVEPPLYVDTHKAMTRMLFNNLIGNALQHTSGLVTVTLHADHVSVCDQGVAGAAAQLQLPGDYKPTSGLGLYIVGLICDQLGWRLIIDPTQEVHCIRIQFMPPTL